MQFEGRKADLAVFKERAEALQKAVSVLDQGIAVSRAQVCLPLFKKIQGAKYQQHDYSWVHCRPVKCCCCMHAIHCIV